MTADVWTRPGKPRRLPHVLLGIGLVVASSLMLLVSLDRAVLVYYLPPNPMTGGSNRHEQLWAPGVVAAVLSGLALLGALVWLGWSCLRRPARMAFWFPVSLTALAALAVLISGGLPVPAF